MSFEDELERDDLVSAEDVVEELENNEEEENEVLSEDAEEGAEQEQEEVDETVERAKKYGHLSKEEWVAQGRDPNQWKSPEEFDKTGKILEQVYSLRKKVDQRDREIQALVDYQQRTSQREYERAKQELEQRLATSKDDMDVEGVAHYTKELVRLQDMEQQTQAQNLQQQQQQALEGFQQRNQHWFNERNPDLIERAVAIDNELKIKHPHASYEELAELIELKMLKEYPERVLGQSKSRPNVAPSQSSVNKTAVNKSSTKRTFQSLPQDLKDTYSATKRIVESRGDREYTVNDFIDQLKKDGELK